MKPIQVLLVTACLLAGAATAQEVVGTIPIPAVGPANLAFNFYDTMLFVANSGTFWDQESTVAVIDCRTEHVVNLITVGLGPGWVYWNWVDSLVYCGLYDRGRGNELVVINRRGDSIVRRIQLSGTGPWSLAHVPSRNKLYIPCRGGTSYGISIVNCDLGIETGFIPMSGSGPYVNALTYSDSSDRVYAGIVTNGMLMVIDAATDSVISDSVYLGVRPEAFAYNWTNNKVYCAPFLSDSLVIIDCGTGHLRRVHVDYQPSVLYYDEEHNRLYCCCFGDTTVVAIDGATDQFIGRVRVGRRPAVLFDNPISDRVFCICYGTPDSVSVIDAASHALLRTLHLPANPYSMAWNPYRNRIYVSCDSSNCIAVIQDSGLSVIEAPARATVRSPAPGPTIVRGVLFLGVDSRQHSAYRAELLDAAGRRVAELRPGANDVSRLAPGVYFALAGGRGPAAVSCQKVIITR